MKKIKINYDMPWRKGEKDKNQLQGQGSRVVNPFYHTWYWRKVAKQHRRDNPFCVECLKNNKTIIGTVTDHVKPINPRDAFDTENGRWGDPLKKENLQTLCDSCHNKKRQKERRN